MNDKELLELAAKAYGVSLVFTSTDVLINGPQGIERRWNPLTDDGDALRLAVKLRLIVNTPSIKAGTRASAQSQDLRRGVLMNDGDLKLLDSDPVAATRRAIVRAAAEIVKNAA